jgi:hypothetical protein
MLTPESIESPSSERKMIGSVLIMEAENIGAVRKAIEEDIYYTSGVVRTVCALTRAGLINHTSCVLQWDPEKLMITPWVPAHIP